MVNVAVNIGAKALKRAKNFLKGVTPFKVVDINLPWCYNMGESGEPKQAKFRPFGKTERAKSFFAFIKGSLLLTEMWSTTKEQRTYLSRPSGRTCF